MMVKTIIPEGWEEITVGNVIVENKKSKIQVGQANYTGKYAFFTSGDDILRYDHPIIDGENIFMATGGVANVKYFNSACSYSTDTYSFKYQKDNRFFYYFLLLNLESINYKLFAGSGLKHLQKKDFKKVKYIFPKLLSEQQKISKILQTIDNVIDKAKELIEKNALIKDGLIQDLFTKGIDEKGNIRSEKTHKFKDSLFKGIKVPENWTLGKMKNVCKVKQGLQIAIALRHKEGGKNRYVYITIQYLSDPARYLEFIENPSESVICKKNDILFTRTGNTGQILTDIEGVFHNNFFKVIYEDKMILRDYLVYFLRQDIIQSLILDLAGTTTIPDLKHKDFYSIPIYFPEDLGEQKRILKLIKEQDRIINKFKDELSKLQRIKDGLMQDLLTGKVRVTPLMREAVVKHG